MFNPVLSELAMFFFCFFCTISVFVDYSSREWGRKPLFHDFLHYTFEKHNRDFEWPRLSGLSSMSISSDTGPRFWVLPLRHVLLEKIENGRQQACLSTCSTDLTVPAGKLHQSFLRVVYYGGQGWVGMGGGAGGILFHFLNGVSEEKGQLCLSSF
jgi:hypothetical protein